MQDPVLRFQTGSELLTLEQEYDMQRKWLEDEDSNNYYNYVQIMYLMYVVHVH